VVAPDRGDLVLIDIVPHARGSGPERRPALVVSPERYNRQSGLALMCAVSRRAKGYPFEVALPDNLKVTGVILADQVKSLDWRVRRAETACTAPQAVTDEVLGKLNALLSK